MHMNIMLFDLYVLQVVNPCYDILQWFVVGCKGESKDSVCDEKCLGGFHLGVNLGGIVLKRLN